MKIGKSTLTWSWGDIQFSKNKSFEYQFEFGRDCPTFNLFEFSISSSSKKDHAGLDFTFSIFPLFWIYFGTYDHRHWNHKENRWAIPGEDLEDS